MSLPLFVEQHNLNDEITQAILREQTLIELFRMMVVEGFSIKNTFGIDIICDFQTRFADDQYLHKLRNLRGIAAEAYFVANLDRFTGLTRYRGDFDAYKTQRIMYELELKWYNQIFEPPVRIQEEQPLRQILWYFVDRYYVLGGSNYDLKELFTEPIDDLFHEPQSIQTYIHPVMPVLETVATNRTREEMLRRRAERKGIAVLELRDSPDKYDTVCQMHRDRFDDSETLSRYSRFNQRLPRSEKEFELCRPSISTRIFPYAELFAWDTTSGRQYRETHDAANYFLKHLTPFSNAQRIFLLVKLEDRWKTKQSK